MFQRLCAIWKSFWGTNYYVYEDGKLEKKVLIYHHKIYVDKLENEVKK